jgi:hypothetical protein
MWTRDNASSHLNRCLLDSFFFYLTVCIIYLIIVEITRAHVTFKLMLLYTQYIQEHKT